MLPKWLLWPVERQSLTYDEAERLYHLWRSKPAFLLDDELELVMKLDRWNQLAMLDTEAMVRQ